LQLAKSNANMRIASPAKETLFDITNLLLDS
jgi:hypothetical protein